MKNCELRTPRAFENVTSALVESSHMHSDDIDSSKVYVWGAGFVFLVRNSSKYSLVHVHIGVTSYHRDGSEKIDKHVLFNFLQIMVP